MNINELAKFGSKADYDKAKSEGHEYAMKDFMDMARKDGEKFADHTATLCFDGKPIKNANVNAERKMISLANLHFFDFGGFKKHFDLDDFTVIVSDKKIIKKKPKKESGKEN